jgi:uncharacterized phage-associated protein
MNITEQKLLNGIKFFIKNTKNVGRTKLFKLLYFWDFIHFKRYGTSVTGLDYHSFPFGPVPKDLYDKILSDSLPEIYYSHFKIVEDKYEENEDKFRHFRFLLKNKTIDLDWLTPNELKVLKDVSFIFKETTAKEMTEITHLKNTPWSNTYEKGKIKKIDYLLALDDDADVDLETAKEKLQIQKELLKDGRL